MAVNYGVVATVVDIERDEPQPHDTFIVDTNVWYWTAYSRASLSESPPDEYQINAYPAYIDKAMEVGATIYRSLHILVELFALIEKVEAEVYKAEHRLPSFSRKEFRHSADAVRENFRAELESVWGQVVSCTKPLSQIFDSTLEDRFLSECRSSRLDSYDLLQLFLASDHGITRIITDDGDFSTIPGITVHTANRRILHAALRRGQLAAARTTKST